MDDQGIIRLYWERNERAIIESASKYGAYLRSIAGNILNNEEDIEECVNDTWLRAWEAIPPARPSRLSVFFGKITRNLSFDRYRYINRDKRGNGAIGLVLDELKDCVSGKDDPESTYEAKELMREINSFLNSLSEERRAMFILRYWYADSISSIAGYLGLSENNVSVSLSRIRSKLQEHLIERGFKI